WAAERMAARGLPVVTLGKQVGTRVPHVDLRTGRVGELLLEHLHAQGARRIALLIASGRRQSYVDVEAAYRRFARERGSTPLVFTADESGGEDAGYARCVELLQQHPEVDAVCATVDAFAVGA